MSDCLFCKIAAHAIPVKPVHEDDLSIAFADIHPQAPTHLLVIPKQHFATVEDMPAELLGHLLHTAAAHRGEGIAGWPPDRDQHRQRRRADGASHAPAHPGWAAHDLAARGKATA